MCELCAKPDEKNVLIELRDIHSRSGAKYEAGIEAITKALGYDSERQQKEISPFRAVRELEEISKDRVEEGLLKLYDEMRTAWFQTEKASKSKTFVLNGRIFINPKTGKPLTDAQWKTIKQDVLKAFDFLYAYEEERIALHALALGKVIKGLPLDKKLTASYKSLKPAVDDAMEKLTGPEWQDTVRFAKQEAATMIVELKQKQYRDIHDTIQNGIKQRNTTGQLTESLYDKFGGMNRDWRRIAETEIGNAQNNGQLITELGRRKKGEKYVFMKGISSAEACPWCRDEIDGRIVVLLEEPPDDGGDKVTVDGETYTAIWPGKSNYGRKRSAWWVAAGTQHPHCILPGQEVAAALPSSAFKGLYKGRVIEIGLSDGSKLTVTENHPILTPDGFVAAKFLNEGANVVASSNADRVMQSINPDHYQRYPRIEDFHAAASHASSVPSRVMPVSPEDFHGDGVSFHEDVEVVNTYGLLGSDIEQSLFEHRNQSAFGFVDSWRLFTGYGVLTKHGDPLYGPPPCRVRALDEVFTNLRGSFGHTGSHALATVPWDDPGFDQAVAEGRPTHTGFSREFLSRFPVEVSGNDTLGEVGVLVTRVITHVTSYDYVGPVYDLTDDIYGLYTVNGVVVKNCRCTWVKHTPGYEEWDDKFRQAMNQARAKGEKMKKPPNDFGTGLKPNPF